MDNTLKVLAVELGLGQFHASLFHRDHESPCKAIIREVFYIVHRTALIVIEHVYNYYLIRLSIFLLLTSCNSLRMTMAAIARFTASSE
jgi:hypothetical protein